MSEPSLRYTLQQPIRPGESVVIPTVADSDETSGGATSSPRRRRRAEAPTAAASASGSATATATASTPSRSRSTLAGGTFVGKSAVAAAAARRPKRVPYSHCKVTDSAGDGSRPSPGDDSSAPPPHAPPPLPAVLGGFGHGVTTARERGGWRQVPPQQLLDADLAVDLAHRSKGRQLRDDAAVADDPAAARYDALPGRGDGDDGAKLAAKRAMKRLKKQQRRVAREAADVVGGRYGGR